MGLHSDGSSRGASWRIEAVTKGTEGKERVEKASFVGSSSDLSTEMERLKEQFAQEKGGGGLTGLGIRVHPNHRSRSFLSLGDDDDEQESGGGGASPSRSSRRRPSIASTVDKSDAVSIASTSVDLDLTPLVNAFPSPPTPTSLASPISLQSRLSPSPLSFESRLPELHHRPSISTISSELTLASTISSNSSLETPSPQTPTVAEMMSLGVAVPRPNAASIRRVRSFAKPVSVYFSPNRPPALPLPSLPSTETNPASPSLQVPSFESSPRSAGDKALSSSMPSMAAPDADNASTNQVPFGFYAPSYGRNPRPRPPTAPPPDRPLPSIPSPSEQDLTPRDSRLVIFPTGSTKKLPLPPPLSSPRADALPHVENDFAPSLPSKDQSSLVVESNFDRSRSSSTGSDSSTPTIKTRSTSLSSISVSQASPPVEDSANGLSQCNRKEQRQIRTRVESNNSVASLDVSQISLQLNQLAAHGTTLTPVPDSPSITLENKTGEKEEGVKAQPPTEREVDRERVRRLISRVSSVIEMRKMSTASLASTSGGSSATNSMVSNSPAERNGYKAYKLARKPSMSPSNSFASFAGGQSPFNQSHGGSVSGDHSRTSSYDSDSDSSASEEMFDLSFDTSSASSNLLSPASIVTSPPSYGTSPSSGRSSYIRRSHIPPRRGGRRRSSATTIEEDEGEDRLKRAATRRADELFGQSGEVYEEDEEAEIEELCGNGKQENVRKPLRSVTSTESFGSRLQQPMATTSGKTLRTVTSLPMLRGSSHPSSTFPRQSTYTPSPLASRSSQTSTPASGLKPLITSSPPHVRKSFLPSPTPSSRIPLSGFSRNSLSPSAAHPPQFSDPFSSTSSPPLGYRSSSSNLRKSSLPVPSTVSPQLSPTGSRRPSAPASYHNGPHQRKPSLAALSYHHTPSVVSPEISRAVSPTSRIGKLSPAMNSRIAQPSFASIGSHR
ncbi:hypothetical protein JCM3765_002512 [Sporobolomyces pararoseus]